MKHASSFAIALVISAASMLDSAWAQGDNSARPATNPPSASLPAAVANRLGGATVTPVPGAKPMEGVVLPPMFPQATPGNKKTDK